MTALQILACCVLVALGVAFHFVTKFAELEQQGTIATPWQYWRQHPWTSALVIMSAYLFMAMQLGIHELTYTSAILTGIACNSLGDRLRARANAKLDQIDNDKEHG